MRGPIQLTCSTRHVGCKKWDMTTMPCKHAVSTITKAKLRPGDYVHDFFKKPMYLAAYSPIIFHVLGPNLWSKTKTRDIEPPVMKYKARKQQTKRRRSKFVPAGPKDTSRMTSITCGNCNLVGHGYTSCQKTVKPGLAMRKSKHQSNKTEEGTTSTAAASSVVAPTRRATIQGSRRSTTRATSPTRETDVASSAGAPQIAQVSRARSTSSAATSRASTTT